MVSLEYTSGNVLQNSEKKFYKTGDCFFNQETKNFFILTQIEENFVSLIDLSNFKCLNEPLEVENVQEITDSEFKLISTPEKLIYIDGFFLDTTLEDLNTSLLGGLFIDEIHKKLYFLAHLGSNKVCFVLFGEGSSCFNITTVSDIHDLTEEEFVSLTSNFSESFFFFGKIQHIKISNTTLEKIN